VEALRTAFFEAPSDVNEATWDALKLLRNFNSFKNSFYKDIKKRNDNLAKKCTCCKSTAKRQRRFCSYYSCNETNSRGVEKNRSCS
jgi:hypothetical protein